MKCNCKNNINISSADIKLRDISGADIKLRDLHRIDITLTREPDTPLISELREQIAELKAIGLEFEDLDRRLKEALEELDVVSKSMLVEMLQEYAKKSDLETLKADLKEWADSRFMRKMFLSQEAYDALEEKEENVLYCIL